MSHSTAQRTAIHHRLAGKTSVPHEAPLLRRPDPSFPGNPAAWRWLLLALLALAAGALAIDCSIAQWFSQRNYPKLLAELIQLCEPFGHGLGVLVLALLIYQLDTTHRWVLPRVLVCSLGAGMTANGIKMLIARTRPRHFDFEGNVLATFGEWFPLGQGGAATQSFPSAHTATAFGFAVALAWLYPQGRRMFGILAVLVACQRLQSGSHYLSDVLVGATVGLVVARACLGPGWLATQFDRLESRFPPSPTHVRDTPAPPANLPEGNEPDDSCFCRAA